MQLLVMQISSDKTQIVKVPDLCKKTCSVAELQEFVSDKDRKTVCYYLLFDWKCKLYLIKWYVYIKQIMQHLPLVCGKCLELLCFAVIGQFYEF